MRKISFLFLLIFFPVAGFPAYTLQDGKLVKKEEVATDSVQEHFSQLMGHYDREAWNDVIQEARVITKNFSSTAFAKEAPYFLGVAYYHLEEYDMANTELTAYLTEQAAPKYFEQAIQLKFEIAEKFRGGARKHLMGFKSMPKWVPAGDEPIAIYDEVIAALPHHELAAHALFGKAQIQFKREDFRAAIESYHTLIRRFPKHPLAVESYIAIGEVYYAQSQKEYPDPDYLDLAQLNLQKFRSNFPGEEKVAVAEGNFILMQDHYADHLFETAKFYERTNKWGAAKIYYTKIVKSYPQSPLATKSAKRLETVEAKISRLEKKKSK